MADHQRRRSILFNGIVTQPERIRVVNPDDPEGPPIEFEMSVPRRVCMEWSLLEAEIRQRRVKRPPGAPRGPRAIRDRADLEARLVQIVSHIDKNGYAMTRETIACTLRLLLIEQSLRDNISHAVKKADRDHEDAKAATQNLRRWCHDYAIDLDQLINRVRTP